MNHNLIRAGNFSVLHSVISGSGACSVSFSMGTGCPVPVGTALGQEADPTLPPNAKMPSLGMSSLLGLHGRHRENFTFTITEF
jgi:hypothetical protein